MMPAEVVGLVPLMRAKGVRHFLYVASAGIAAERRAECSALLRACRDAQLPVTLIVPGTFYDDFLNVWPVTRTFWLRRLVWWGVPLRLQSTACTFLPMLSRRDFGTIVLGLALQAAKNDTLYAIAECSPVTSILNVLSRRYAEPVLYRDVTDRLRQRLAFPDRPDNWEDVNQNRLELSSKICHALHPDIEPFEQWAERELPHHVDKAVLRYASFRFYLSHSKTVLLYSLGAASVGGCVVYMLHSMGLVRVVLPTPVTTSLHNLQHFGANLFQGVVCLAKLVAPSSLFTPRARTV